MVTPKTLKTLLENIISLYHAFAQTEYANISRTPFVEAITTVDSAWPNMIFNHYLTAKHAKDGLGLSEIAADIKEQQLPPVMMCAPDTDPSILDNLKATEAPHKQWQAMVAKREQVSELLPTTNFRIEKVTNPKQLKSWLAIVEKELMVNKPLNSKLFAALLNDHRFHFVLGYCDDEPVATAFSFVADSNMGLYLVSTSKTYRGRGFGKQISIAAIKGHPLHFSNIYLQATALGEPVYEAIGFTSISPIDVFNLGK